MLLKGKVAVITGGSRGIGLASAHVLQGHGAQVVIVGRDAARLESAVGELGGGAHAIQADISIPTDIERVIKEIGARYGLIDVIVANSGTSHCPPLEEMTEQQYDSLMSVNVKGTVFTVVYAMPLLREDASIILIGSVAGRKGRPGDPLYAASKGAVRSFGRTLAMSEGLLARRIRVNVVSPGATETPMTAAVFEDSNIRSYVEAMIPMGRWAKPEEIAQTIAFLASSSASYITGAEITVDGGLAHA